MPSQRVKTAQEPGGIKGYDGDQHIKGWKRYSHLRQKRLPFTFCVHLLPSYTIGQKIMSTKLDI
jgi:hypothetical protein